MRILLTGGHGFIGYHMAEALEGRGWNVLYFDRKSGLDVTDYNKVRDAAFNCDAIVNLAGVLGTHELNETGAIREAVDVNIHGSLNCLRAATKFGIPMLQAAKPNLWLNTYSITKQASEDFSRLFAAELGARVWIVRWFNVYGPGQHYGSPQKLGPTAIVRALKGESIPVFGDGEQTADHIYVKDAVDAALAVFDCDDVMGTPVEVGTGKETTVNAFVSMVKKMAFSGSRVEFLPMRSGEAEHAVVKADIEVLRDVVGWTPSYTLGQGLRETVDWYRENLI